MFLSEALRDVEGLQEMTVGQHVAWTGRSHECLPWVSAEHRQLWLSGFCESCAPLWAR